MRRIGARPPAGEPLVWLANGGLALALLMIAALLALIFLSGIGTFWPGRLTEMRLVDGAVVAGEVVRSERFRPEPPALVALPEAAKVRIAGADGLERRRLVRVGNYDLYGDDFRWVADHEIASESLPDDLWLVERMEWGPAIGRVDAVLEDGQPIPPTELASRIDAARERRERIRKLERGELGAIDRRLEQQRLAIRRVALDHGEGSVAHRTAAATAANEEIEVAAARAAIEAEIAALREADARERLRMTESRGGAIPERPSNPETPLLLSQVTRAYPANRLGVVGRLGIYLARWWEFLASEPREANTEGGVFPALFGTLVMTMLMSLAVGPFGVIAALYLREYARQGVLVSAVRIAVGNLAGVPSIVFGVFGLGFFCYAVGGRIDQVFFPERLPTPTFGTGGLLWASLTLALLTVPVVIVVTEEALAAVPRSLREGSYGCGASRWQTIQRIVLPHATPGILTGLILAMARGAGEVAPLMITGVVKLAPDLPFDGWFPFVHLERSFMHLGFHIYDVGFQSRNAEAGKPMVFTTTLLLIVLIALLNALAIRARSRLRRRFASAQF